MINLDGKTVAVVIGAVAVVGVSIALGSWMGKNSVLENERLAAQSSVTYQLVTIHNEAPSPELMMSAMNVCGGEQDSSRDVCITNFLSQYGNTYMINLVDGTRELLSPETMIKE